MHPDMIGRLSVDANAAMASRRLINVHPRPRLQVMEIPALLEVSIVPSAIVPPLGLNALFLPTLRVSSIAPVDMA
jgi:hypothetical protein